MQIKIDKGMPMPGPSLGRNRKYPWLEMQVGDSFLAPGKTESVRRIASDAGRRAGDGRRFSVHITPEGARVWRVS